MARRAASKKSAKTAKTTRTTKTAKTSGLRAGARAGERARDEQRAGGGPRMHGRDWHDHDSPKPLDRERMAGLDSMTEVESSGDRTGMGRRAIAARPTQSRERRKRTTPVGKGIRTKASRR